ncbi:hypothetical protein ebA1705 [Aromatoleum aromaticum EbN1]|uniref:Uncharacterized protein n=1 Tax=Aromatoleum aromaticum (strain DSM 19018 / LMG 30748 / EbN1) TaxID=76114 RepID=Q5P6L6_AROAE|nr:hypothetical protein ebA1705 [Aromatoleum aromaticum EbN1]
MICAQVASGKVRAAIEGLRLRRRPRCAEPPQRDSSSNQCVTPVEFAPSSGSSRLRAFAGTTSTDLRVAHGVASLRAWRDFWLHALRFFGPGRRAVIGHQPARRT